MMVMMVVMASKENVLGHADDIPRETHHHAAVGRAAGMREDTEVVEADARAAVATALKSEREIAGGCFRADLAVHEIAGDPDHPCCAPLHLPDTIGRIVRIIGVAVEVAFDHDDAVHDANRNMVPFRGGANDIGR